MNGKFVLSAAIVGIVSAASPATACDRDGSPEEIRRMLDDVKRKAPIVVKGYVQTYFEKQNSPASSERLIPREFIKGARRDAYALVPAVTSCDIEGPRDKRERWKIYLQPTQDKFRIVSVERYIEAAE